MTPSKGVQLSWIKDNQFQVISLPDLPLINTHSNPPACNSYDLQQLLKAKKLPSDVIACRQLHPNSVTSISLFKMAAVVVKEQRLTIDSLSSVVTEPANLSECPLPSLLYDY